MQRQTHDMPQPFTVSDIRAYADVCGFVKAELSVYFEIIQEMDALYLKITYAKIEDERRRAAENAKRNQGNG